MSWIILAFASALTDAFQNLFRKKQVTKLDPLSLGWLLFLFASIAFLPFLKDTPNDLSNLFWAAILVRTMLDTAASYLFLKSVEHTDLSLSVPVTAFTPVFIIFFEFILTGQSPTALGVLGIVLIALGAYLLNVNQSSMGMLAPFKEIYRNKGMFFMLGVAILWSLTSTLHGVAIGESSAYFYLSLGSLLLLASFSLLLIMARGKNAFSFLTPKVALENLPAGIFGILTNLTQMLAQGMFLASYVIAIKRTSILFSSILGGIFLNEPIKKRILPTLIIVAGVVLLVLTN